MTPREIVGGLRDPARRAEAARALLSLLGDIATRLRIPPQEQDDLVQTVSIKLLEQAVADALQIYGTTDAVCEAYFRRCVWNLWVSRCRSARRRDFVEVDESRLPAAPAEEESAATIEQATQAMWALLDRVANAMVEAHLPRYRNDKRRDWNQIQELFRDPDASLDRIVIRDDELGSVFTAEQLEQARNRAFQQHKRCRKALADAVDRMEATGELEAEDARNARRLVEGLVRCQQPAGSRVSEGGASRSAPAGTAAASRGTR